MLLRQQAYLVVLFALIASISVAAGVYFVRSALVQAHRQAFEARFVIAASTIVGAAERAASLGVALPAQHALEGLADRQRQLDPLIRGIRIEDEARRPLFAVGDVAPSADIAGVTRPIHNDIGAVLGRVVVRYDRAAERAGIEATDRGLRLPAFAAIGLAALATLGCGLALMLGLRRRLRLAADSATWPAAAAAGRAELDDLQRRFARYGTPSP